MFPKAKKLKVVLSQRIRGHSFMTSAKKVKSSDPTQQPSNIDHPSVLQQTYIILNPPPSKKNVSEFFPKTLAIRSTHLYQSFFLR